MLGGMSSPAAPLLRIPPTDAALSTGEAQRQQLLDRVRQVRLLVESSPALSALVGVLIVAQMVLEAARLLSIGWVVTALAAADHPSMVTALIVLGGALLAAPLLGAATDIGAKALDRAVQVRRSDDFAAAVLTPDTLRHLDTPELSEEAQSVASELRGWQILLGTESTVTTVTMRVSALAPVIVIGLWNVWAALILLVVFQIVAVVMLQHLSRLMAALTKPPGPAKRRSRYFFDLATGPAAAKEVRLFGLLPWITPHLAGSEDSLRESSQEMSLRRPQVLAMLLGLVALLGTIVLIIADATAGRISPGQIAALVVAAVSLVALVGPIGDPHLHMIVSGRLQRRIDDLARASRLVAGPSHPAAGTVQPTAGAPTDALPPSAPGAGIEIRDLAFRYPGRDTDTLHNLSLSIPAGQSVGVVGVNGAGKSTLMSLIAGLERPSAGTIEVGGRPLTPAAEGRPTAAVIFQEFSRYPLDVRANVTLGRPADDEQVAEQVRRAGGTDLLHRLTTDDDGLGTILAPGFEGGTSMSGGQWQRVALARALAAVDAGAQVLVLDEPTSALDVRAEAEIFDDFLRVTRGATTLLVSHRLSSVRRADRIVVLDAGRITEDGTHDELMAAGGAYARMFTTQAQRFQEAGGHDDDDA
ncbi:hypothetical protein HEMA109418_10450 [Helcobacillus massiliensis]